MVVASTLSVQKYLENWNKANWPCFPLIGTLSISLWEKVQENVADIFTHWNARTPASTHKPGSLSSYSSPLVPSLPTLLFELAKERKAHRPHIHTTFTCYVFAHLRPIQVVHRNERELQHWSRDEVARVFSDSFHIVNVSLSLCVSLSLYIFVCACPSPLLWATRTWDSEAPSPIPTATLSPISSWTGQPVRLHASIDLKPV